MRDAAIPEIPGVLSADQLSATVDAIAEWQLPSGMIPWFPGGHADPWNHVEAAMALDLVPAAADVEGHRGLDMVPDVGVAAGEPRDHPRGQLPLGDGVDRRRQFGGRDGPFDIREERHRRLSASVAASGLSA